MNGVTIYRLLFTIEVVTPLELEAYPGSALRGSLYDAVWQRFCTNKAAPTCADCPLHTFCPVSALVAPLRDEYARGRDIPRPYVIQPPPGPARRYEPGETLQFGLTLFGSIIDLLPYILLASDTLERAGLGRKSAEQNWQRGTFKIQRVEAEHPFTGEKECLYERGKALVNVPVLAVNAADIQARAASLPLEQVTLHFLTPTRLIQHGRLVLRPAFTPLIHRLLERLYALNAAYNAEQRDTLTFEEQTQLLSQADQVQCLVDQTTWYQLESHSRRLKRSTYISGLLGEATFAGELAPFRELLVWGELIQVGKNAVKGSGWYRLHIPPLSQSAPTVTRTDDPPENTR
jgi:hypothetical protein